MPTALETQAEVLKSKGWGCVSSTRVGPESNVAWVIQEYTRRGYYVVDGSKDGYVDAYAEVGKRGK